MEKVIFKDEDVIAFVEELILDEMANDDVLEWYENYVWNNEFKKNYARKSLISKMKRIYENGF